MVKKVVPSILALLAKPPYKISTYAKKGMIEGTFKHKILLSKHLAINGNWRYL